MGDSNIPAFLEGPNGRANMANKAGQAQAKDAQSSSGKVSFEKVGTDDRRIGFRANDSQTRNLHKGIGEIIENKKFVKDFINQNGLVGHIAATHGEQRADEMKKNF